MIIIISDKTDLKIKTMVNVREEHCIMIKGPTQEEDMTAVNFDAPSTGAPQSTRQMLTATRAESRVNTVMAGSLTPHLH